MTAQEDPVDALVLEYLRALEAGETTDLDRLASRLDDPEQQRELRQLVQTATWVRSTFPVPLVPQARIADRYVLLEHLGSGGFGKVWRARDEKLGREVALKLFHALLDDDEVAATLAREQQALAALTHDGIVRLIDRGRHDDLQFLVMELVVGVPLDRFVTAVAARSPDTAPPTRTAVEQALPAGAIEGATPCVDDDWPRTCAQVAVEVLWALAAAHARGIVHRDLKPSNVLLRAGARPVVLDFGLAGLRDRSGAMTERLFGTAAYLAPEQLEAQHMGKDPRTDVYQCGLLLYELLTLRRAFEGVPPTELLGAVRKGSIPRPGAVRTWVPLPLDDICLRALQHDPAHRYPSADAFRLDLERWLAHQTPLASRLGCLGRGLRDLRATVRRHRTTTAMAGALLVGIVATAAMLNHAPEVRVLAASGSELTLRIDNDVYVLVFERVAEDRRRLVPAAAGSDPAAFGVNLTKGRQILYVGDAAADRLNVVPLSPELVPRWPDLRDALLEQQQQLGSLDHAQVAAVVAEQRTRGGGDVLDAFPIDAIFAR